MGTQRNDCRGKRFSGFKKRDDRGLFEKILGESDFRGVPCFPATQAILQELYKQRSS